MCSTHVFTLLFTLYRIRRHTRISYLYIWGTTYYVQCPFVFIHSNLRRATWHIFWSDIKNIFHTVNKNSYLPTWRFPRQPDDHEMLNYFLFTRKQKWLTSPSLRIGVLTWLLIIIIIISIIIILYINLLCLQRQTCMFRLRLI